MFDLPLTAGEKFKTAIDICQILCRDSCNKQESNEILSLVKKIYIDREEFIISKNPETPAVSEENEKGDRNT